jgi:hypothetical protein
VAVIAWVLINVINDGLSLLVAANWPAHGLELVVAGVRQELVGATDVRKPRIVLGEPRLHSKVLTSIQALHVIINLIGIFLFEFWFRNIFDACWPV